MIRWTYARSANIYPNFRPTPKTSLLGALFGIGPLFFWYYVFKTDRVSIRTSFWCLCNRVPSVLAVLLLDDSTSAPPILTLSSSLSCPLLSLFLSSRIKIENFSYKFYSFIISSHTEIYFLEDHDGLWVFQI